MDIRENDIDDTKLLEAMQVYINEPSRQTLMGLVMALKEAEVFVPVKINQEKQIIQPYIIKNKEDDLYVPIFTSVGKFPEDQAYQGMQKTQYKHCVSMLLEADTAVEGLVLNPYTDNLMLKKQMLELSQKVEQDMSRPQTASIKIEDFRMIARHTAESRIIPQMLFEKKLEFIQELSAERLCEIYKKPYIEVKQEGIYEYTAADFDIMELELREDMNMMQIMLPSKYLYKTNCREMYIVWNPETERINCYAVEKGTDPEKDEFFIKEMKPDGSKEDLGEAASEGNVMNQIMELFEAVREG